MMHMYERVRYCCGCGLCCQAGLWSGDLVLRDLQGRTDVSRKLHLPIVLKQGSVDLVRIQVRSRLHHTVFHSSHNCRLYGRRPNSALHILSDAQQPNPQSRPIMIQQ